MLKKEKLTLTVLCAGHFVNDSYSSVIYPLLPLIKTKLHLTTAEVFWLAPLYAVSSSLMQPVYGFLSDRYARRSFAVLGPVITGVFISLIGLAPSYGLLLVLLVASGIGVGSFHPQAAAMAAVASGEKRRIGLATFSAAGTLGFAIGPFIITRVVSAFGLDKTYYIIAIGILMSIVLYRVCPPLEDVRRPSAETAGVKRPLLGALHAVWKPLLLLYLITVIRSGLQVTTNNYLPFMLGERGYNLTGTGNVMTVFLLLGGVGGLVGGFVAERVSGRAVTLYSGLFAGPLMIAAFLTSGPVSIALLGVGGFVLLATMPVNVAMAQELAPGQTSTVSALMMGAAWGVGALAPPVLDPFVPAYGFTRVMVFASAVTMVSGVLAYFLPRDERKSRPLIESELATAAGD